MFQKTNSISILCKLNFDFLTNNIKGLQSSKKSVLKIK